MKIFIKNNTIVFENIAFFDLKHTLQSGQTFRLVEQSQNHFAGVVDDHYVDFVQNHDNLIIKTDFLDVDYWKNYLAEDLNYTAILQSIDHDERIKEAIQKTKGGVRILRQNPYEVFLSFLCAQNTNIKNIEKMIHRLSETYGEKKTFLDTTYYTFPKPEALLKGIEADFRALGLGYRSRYLYHAVKKIHEENIDFFSWAEDSSEDISEKLQQFLGIGEKVAHCILLFGFGRVDTFPADVWIKRMMAPYGDKEVAQLGKKLFGEYGGFAQQYLFHYGRVLSKEL